MKLWKNTDKRSCVIEIAREVINLYIQTNKDAIELIKTYENVTVYITGIIKKKKYKDLKLKIISDKRMNLESIMIETYIGA